MKKSKVNFNFLNKNKKNMKENESDSAIDNTEETSGATGNEQELELTDASTEQKDKVAGLEAELSAAKDKYLRLGADFENYKKRVTKERIEMIKMAGSDVLISILPVIDDLERALKSTNDAADVKSVKEGINLIFNKIKSITESRELKPMESIGKEFDPDLHDAIANIPAPSKDMKGKVIEEIEKGYYLNDKVIRHAKVIVGN
jgi:molecular chaperone GrpE